MVKFNLTDFITAAIVATLYLVCCALADQPEQERIAEEELQAGIHQEKLEQAKLKAQIKSERKRLAKLAEDMTNVKAEIKE